MPIDSGSTRFKPFVEQPTPAAGLRGPTPMPSAPIGADTNALLQQYNANRQKMYTPEPEVGPVVAFSQSKNRMFVNGLEFDVKDAATALKSEQYLSAPRQAPPDDGNDWTQITPDEYQSYLNTIKKPDLGRLASKNFEIGMSNMGSLYGAGLQFIGMEKEGSAMVAEADKNIGYLEPFQQTVEKNNGIVEWFVGNIAQQGPNLIESVLMATAGALVGSASAGPLGGAAGALGGVFAKGEVKAALKAAVKDYAEAKIAKDTVKMKAAADIIRPAAAAVGALAFTAADNYRMGVSDVYGELRGNGVEAGDMNARLAALGSGIPYAALETLPEAVLGLKLFGKWKGAGNFVSRGAKGFAAGGVMEGVTEAGQEGLLINTGKAFGHVYDSDEELSRYINSFAAGFAVGGPIGGIANIAAGKPADLLKSVGKPNEEPPPAAGLKGPDGGYPRPPGSAPTEAELLDKGERSFSPDAYPIWPGPKPLINRGTGGKFGEIGNFGAEVVDGRAPPAATPTLVGPDIGAQVEPAPGAVEPSGPLPTPPTGNFGEIGPFGAEPVAPNQTLPLQAPAATPQQTALSAPTPTATPQSVPAGQDLLQSPDFKALQAEVAQQTVDAPDAINIAAQQASQADEQQQLPLGQLKLQKRRNAPVSTGGLVTTDGLKGPEQLELPLDNSLKKSRARAAAKNKAAATEAAAAATKKAADKDKADQEAIDRENQNVLEEAKRREALARADAAELKAQELRDKAEERKAKIKEAAERLKAKAKETAAPAEPKPLTAAAKERARRAAAKAEGEKTSPPAVSTPETKPDVVSTITRLKKELGKSWVPIRTLREALPQYTKAELDAELARLASEKKITPTINEDAGSLTEEDIAAGFKVGPGPVRATGNYQMVTTKEQTNETQPVQPPAAEKAPAGKKNLQRKAAGVASTEQAGSVGADTKPAATAATAPAQVAGTQAEAVAAVKPTNAVGRWAAREKDITAFLTKNPETRDSQAQLDALEDIVSDDGGLLDMAFFTTESQTNLKAPKSDEDQRSVPQRALDFLRVLVGGDGQPGVVTEAQRQVIYDAFVGMAREKTRYASNKGVERAWYTFAKDPIHNLLGRLDVSRIKSIPAEDKHLFPVDNGTVMNPSIAEAKENPESQTNEIPVTEKKPAAAPDEKAAATKQLTEIINQILTGNLQANGDVRLQMRNLFEKADPNAQVGDRVMGGKPVVIGQFFDEGKVKFKKLPNGKYVLSASTGKDVVSKFFRSGKPSVAMPAGRVQLVAKAFLSKLTVRPELHIFKDLAEMKAKNRPLYDEANNRGGFDDTQAAGISFNNKVVLFSDHMHNETQVRFIMAHETIGHYGFRSIMPQAQLNKMLQEVYERDDLVRFEADRKAKLYGISTTEATEEVMADMAAHINNSILVRAWNYIKTALNKIGLTFGDELARHMIFQSRRYVRYGATSVFGYDNYIEALKEMGRREVVTRYSRTADEATISGASILAGSVSQEAAFATVDNFLQDLKTRGEKALRVTGSITSVIETLGHKAQRSAGLQKIFYLFQKQGALAKALKTNYMELSKYTRATTAEGGPTNAQIDKANELLAYVALSRSQNLDTKELFDGADLIVNRRGRPTLDMAAVEALIQKAMPTVEEIKAGIKLTLAGKEITYAIPDLEETSPVWKIFLEQRNVVNRAAADELLHKYRGIVNQRRAEFDKLEYIRDTSGNRLSEEDKAWLRGIADTYEKIFLTDSVTDDGAVKLNKASVEKAEEFIESILKVLHDNYKDKEAVREWLKDSPASDSVAAKFQGDEYKAAREYLRNFAEFKADGTFNRKRTINQDRQYQILNSIRTMVLSTTQLQNAGLYAKSTILSNYVPFVRNGDMEIKLVARTVGGKPVDLSREFRGQLPYFRTSDSVVEKNMVKALTSAFGDRTYKILDANDNEVEVTFHAESQKAPKSETLASTLDYDEFVRVLTRLNIDLKPDERHRIVNALAGQHAAARKNLERTGTPGWDPDMVRAVGVHAEMKAHTSARNEYRFELTDILLDDNLWLGDRDKLQQLHDAIGRATNPAARYMAEQEYARYAYQMIHMAPKGSAPIKLLNGKEEKPEGNGRDYQEAAKDLMRWYADTGNISESTEDALSGPLGSAAKLAVVTATLGGSIATGAVNLVSLATHTIPALAFNNRNRGFGGGFGLAAAAAETFKALRQMTDLSTGRVEDLTRMIQDGTYAAKGLTRDEAMFLLTQTKQGILDAAQQNAMSRSARGGIRNRAWAKALEIWMSPFSTTERINRRSTALAAYRLNKARSVAAGADVSAFATMDIEDLEFDKLFGALSHEAADTVNNSQGEYAMYNRPPMARGNVLQYLFIFKMYPILTTELIAALPPAGRTTLLASLFLMAGYKGLPFFDDIMDLIDTLCQKFGITKHDLEQDILKLTDSIAPGSGKLLQRGIIDSLTGSTVSTKVGLGDMIPLTGAFRDGANFEQEMSNFLGPLYSSATMAVDYAGTAGKVVAETVGLSDRTSDPADLLRKAPLTAFRSLGDAFSYARDGRITDTKGRVVSKDVSPMVVITRALGFFPGEATSQNDMVRMATHAAEHAKAIKARYVVAYADAKVKGDTAKMAEVANDVREWNSKFKGTEFEINDFIKAGNRSAKERGQSTADRYLRSAPKNVRPGAEEMLNILGYDSETE